MMTVPIWGDKTIQERTKTMHNKDKRIMSQVRNEYTKQSKVFKDSSEEGKVTDEI